MRNITNQNVNRYLFKLLYPRFRNKIEASFNSMISNMEANANSAVKAKPQIDS